MELIIKLNFILAMVGLNVSILSVLMNIKDEVKQKSGFMAVAGFDILATTSMLLYLHPHMADSLPALAFSGFIGGGAIIAAASFPFKS